MTGRTTLAMFEPKLPVAASVFLLLSLALAVSGIAMLVIGLYTKGLDANLKTRKWLMTSLGAGLFAYAAFGAYICLLLAEW